jgi:hypothetical protein
MLCPHGVTLASIFLYFTKYPLSFCYISQIWYILLFLDFCAGEMIDMRRMQIYGL